MGTAQENYNVSVEIGEQLACPVVADEPLVERIVDLVRRRKRDQMIRLALEVESKL